jgi:stalled ribosome rescue protein Dom34
VVVPRSRRRGYPVAILIGLENHEARLWNIYSRSIKPDTVVHRENSDYNFYEAIIDAIRPNVKQGVKTVLIASQNQKTYETLIDHIEKHQRWLIAGYKLNRVTIEYITGSAIDIYAVNDLIEKSRLKRTIERASREDIKRVMSELEKRLSTPNGIDTLRFTLTEVENEIYGEEGAAEYVLITTDFQQTHGRRTQRLLQIAQNKEVKSMVVEAETPMGARLSQFGGLICLLRTV